ncbi:extensin [Streptomyces sp. NPDC059255]|uniref:extensin n=1 Tax=Streptomyces sp. NPDC059255 TaxID=3346793 RepID=UPI0036973F2F
MTAAPRTPGTQSATPGTPGIPGIPGPPASGATAPPPAPSRVVSLAPAAPRPPVALPVQRAAATPAVAPADVPQAARLTTPAAPGRPSTPRGSTTVAVQRAPERGGRPAGSVLPPGNTTAPGQRSSVQRAPAQQVTVQRAPNEDTSEKKKSTDPEPPSVTSQFKPRELKEDQMAELVHRLIGPMTRLLRTELRVDRERIGKLRDPRH